METLAAVSVPKITKMLEPGVAPASVVPELFSFQFEAPALKLAHEPLTSPCQ